MKKIILSALAVCAFTFVSAQDKKETSEFGYSKGDVVLGGNIKFGSTSVDNGATKTSMSDINPTLAYFVSDKFALEIGIDLESTKTTTAAGTAKSSMTGFQVGGRYYFLDLGQRFKTYTDFDLSFGSNDNGGNGVPKTSSMGLGAGLGMNYFVTPKVAIVFGLNNILSYKSSKTDGNKDDSFKLNLNEFNNFFATPTFGIAYKF